MLVVVLFGLSLMPWYPWVTAQEKVNNRVSRAVTPEPVACQLSNWSEWTDCFPCQDTKYRHRSLLQPSKFGGAICSGDIWDEASCNSPTPCLRQAQCGQDFQCRETGRCLKRHLVCNGDNDCLDGSDEDNCEDAMITEDDCHQYNILTQEEALSVYDARYYGGQCETVYNGEWRKLQYDPVCERLYYGDDEKYFRKPYNFLKYHFEGLADTLISSEFYDDSNELFSKIKNSETLSGGITFGIGPPKVPVTLALNVSGSHISSLMNQLSKYNEKRFSFMRVSTKVQTAHFKMRRHNIVLDEGMLQSLMELPEQFNYGMYAKFINDYGTHYITSGTMGGVYEYILVLNKEKMAAAHSPASSSFTSSMLRIGHPEAPCSLQFFPKSSVTAKDIGYCIGGSLGLEFGDHFTVDGGLSGQTCEKSGAANTDKKNKNSAVEDIISRVRGGSSDWGSVLTEDRSIITYRSWGRSLKYNPVVIDFEMQPIHELLRHTNLGPLETKRQNLRRALDQYLMEFNACRCGPCFNNGEAILEGTSCKCQCSRGRQGAACEKMGLEGVKADGRWSCWSSWSECRAGTQERRRQCNNPAPQNGGAPCPGKSTQTRAC